MDPQESDEAFIEVTNLNIPSMKLLLKKESLGSAKQISVDPISLQKESNEQAHPAYSHDDFTPKKLLSFSPPNSTTSTPEFGAEKNNYYCKNQISPLERQHSVALTNLEHLKEINLQRSKSCGEGRASTPPEEFDLWFANNNGSSSVKRHDVSEMSNSNNNTSSFLFHEESSEGSRMDGTYTNNRSSVHLEEKFKCGALCLFIPGRLGKGKPVRSARRRQESGISTSSDQMGHHHVVSRTVSLERFECGSWTSSAVIHEEGDASNNLFFDLPMELIRCNANDDTHSPVTTAFVFDKEVKGVLKNTTKTDPSRKSHESARHVRFSTSSPTSYPPSPTSACVTPRLRRAREDFTTFLEAQSA